MYIIYSFYITYLISDMHYSATVKSSVADPERFDADPDSTFQADADPDPNFFS